VTLKGSPVTGYANKNYSNVFSVFGLAFNDFHGDDFQYDGLLKNIFAPLEALFVAQEIRLEQSPDSN